MYTPDEKMAWETLSQEYVYKSPWLVARKDAVKLPDGRVLDEEPPLVEGYVTADVAARDSLTLYSVIGNAFVYLNIAFSSVLLLSIFKDKIIPKRN